MILLVALTFENPGVGVFVLLGLLALTIPFNEHHIGKLDYTLDTRRLGVSSPHYWCHRPFSRTCQRTE